ncbi:MAG: response regulator [Balneolales bacterium]|nr:response regulator [Balneolales bacterium]
MEISKKALIVEDNLILSVLYQNYLKQKVFKTVGEIRDGESAVKLVKTYDPDVVIMDIMLDGPMDGVEAAQEIRKFSDVPIIFITGNSDQRYVERAREIKNSKFMVKPISEEKLSKAVDLMLN